ncbi:MAG: hypothetical protein IJ456_10945 [Bacteroides sp.]|nr:hypothetical protein [Bacteroides sp.]
MKKIYLTLVSALFACATGFAQTEITAETETTYWVDSTNNAKILNKAQFQDNWYVGVHAGGLFSWGSNTSGAGFFEQIRPAAALSVGKMFGPAGGMRLQALIGSNRGETENGKGYIWENVAGYLDGVFNLTNIFNHYVEGRKFELLGIVGVGLEHTFGFSDKSWNTDESMFKTDNTTSVALRAGLMGKIRLSETLDLNIEAVNNWIDDSYDGQITNNTYDGHVNVLVGLTYRFKNHDDSRQFTYATREMTKYDILNAELNRARAEAAVVLEPEVIVEKKKINSNQIRTLISFEKNVSSINKLQQVNVYTAVQAWAQHNDSDIYITMNENAKHVDGQLFNDRANAIKDMMVKEFQVPAERVIIEVEPESINLLDPTKTDVIVYINE